MSEEARWRACVRALMVDAEGRVLLLEDGDRVRLPYVEVASTDDDLAAIREALTELTGIAAIVVRSIERSVDEEQKTMSMGLELEPLPGSREPAAAAAWRAAADLDSAPLCDDDRSLLELHRADRPAPERPPWARRGWFGEASAWIEEALEARGRRLVGPVEQISNWCISSILRAETEEGRVFFKATARSPLFVDEGTVTRGLAQMLPGRVPAPLAVDSDRRWMLLDDFGPVVGWRADLETRLAVLTTFAGMQLEAAAWHGQLLELGVLDRRPRWLASQIGSLLAASESLGLDAADAAELAELEPWFVEACERLGAGAVPDSLVHGDLHLSNVAAPGGSYVFFDWTDACLAHPFLDLLVVLFEDDAEIRLALRDAYLAAWRETAPEEELLELWRLAEPLASLNQAISYRSILASVEPGTAPELEPATANWLRRALAAAAQPRRR